MLVGRAWAEGAQGKGLAPGVGWAGVGVGEGGSLVQITSGGQQSQLTGELWQLAVPTQLLELGPRCSLQGTEPQSSGGHVGGVVCALTKAHPVPKADTCERLLPQE